MMNMKQEQKREKITLNFVPDLAVGHVSIVRIPLETSYTLWHASPQPHLLAELVLKSIYIVLWHRRHKNPSVWKRGLQLMSFFYHPRHRALFKYGC